MNAPLLLGHRGARGRRYAVRENTFEAFDLALEQGCDGFEFDVRLSIDGEGVICHDPRFGGRAIARTSAKLSTLPSLNDVMARYAARAFLDIELKVGGLESCLLESITRFPPQRGWVVSSFIPEILMELRARSTSIPIGIICETRKQLQRWPELPLDYVMVKESLITRDLIENIHVAGKRIVAWTINRKSSMLCLAQWRIDGIISDRPDLLFATLRGNQRP